MSDDGIDGKPGKAARRRSLLEMALLTVVMFGFGFAFAPLYSALCDLTNLNGRDPAMQIVANVTEQPDLTREVTVQFLTVVNGGRDWQFRPDTAELKVHPGQLYTVNFTAENELDQSLVGQAVPSVSPNKAARHLKKTECFCFTQQAFGPREKKLMPVRFMLDPELPAEVQTVTLSYTFFDVTQLAAAANKPKS